MTIINRYFIRQLFGIFIILLLILTGLAWMMQVMSMMKFLLNYGISFLSFIELTALMIPFIISIIVPFVAFIAVIFIYNKLITESEITVMMSTGLSPLQLAKPAISLACILTLVHLILNIWIVPISQASFYDTQWNLRYGLAHMKLQESAFTRLSDGLVVYVDNVSGHDLNQVMLSDTREGKSEMTIFSEKGKLISTVHGMSLIMDNGSLQTTGKNGITTGTFDTFDMDLNMTEKNETAAFRVRRIPTLELVKTLFSQDNARQHKLAISELCTRLINPFMNLILTILCTLVLLKSSLLRRRTSFAPAIAVLCMSVCMGGLMSISNLINTITGFCLLFIGTITVLGLLLLMLAKK